MLRCLEDKGEVLWLNKYLTFDLIQPMILFIETI